MDGRDVGDGFGSKFKIGTRLWKKRKWTGLLQDQNAPSMTPSMTPSSSAQRVQGKLMETAIDAIDAIDEIEQ